jgi:hypothetical protein
VENHGLCLLCELLRVKNYDPYPSIELVGSDFFFNGSRRLGQMRRS